MQMLLLSLQDQAVPYARLLHDTDMYSSEHGLRDVLWPAVQTCALWVPWQDAGWQGEDMALSFHKQFCCLAILF